MGGVAPGNIAGQSGKGYASQGLTAIVLSTLITMGLLEAALIFVGGRRPSSDDPMGTRQFFLSYLAACIPYDLIVTIGLMRWKRSTASRESLPGPLSLVWPRR